MRSKCAVYMVMILMMFMLNAQDARKASQGKAIESWLMLGPASVTGLERAVYDSNRDIANHRFLDFSDLWPGAGQEVTWSHGRVLKWNPVTRFHITPKDDSLVYFVSFIDAAAYLKTKLVINGIHKSMLNLYLNGREVKKQYDKKTGKVTAELTLLNKKHVLLIKVFVPKGEAYNLDARIMDSKQVESGEVAFSTSLARRVDFGHILNSKGVSGLNLSPDGRYLAVSLEQTTADGTSMRWTEILKTADGSRILTSEGMGSFSNLTWMKSSRSFLTSVESKKKTTIYRYDLLTGLRERIISGLKEFSGFQLSPDNTFIMYWTYKKKDRGSGFKYVETIPDRAASDRYDYVLYIRYLNNGATHKIRSFKHDLYQVMISPDSSRVLFSTLKPDSGQRPYYKSTFFLMDLKKEVTEKLFESNLVYPADWSPDSSRIVFTGGPMSFKGIGNILEEGVIPNEYDTQVFIYDIATGNARSITRDFDPSVEAVFWNQWDGNIYLRATDRSFIKLYRYHTGRKGIREIPVPVDAVRRFDVSVKGRFAAFWGSGAVNPHKLYRVDLSRMQTSLLKDYNARDFRYVRFGSVKDWNYRTPEGKTIIGRIHYPLNFNQEKKYPCIVYYYGGTSPVERSFGGRYPFNWYAANGYLVYVLQPSGAVGFGQAFSAVHVNDWGKTTSREIIGATKELVKSHPYIDAKRLGAMGASYGGFMTQYLATQTDMFAAFISHAGISALSSYWGVGDWGYTYSGVATAGSFPWNRRDIYVDQSPLFLADKITTPLLLLHGDKDNNVPPGESYQMFAALKLLGKEVALVTISDQSHWIMNYEKRKRWMKTIMAWFDRWLKDEPEYWDSLYSKYMSGKEKQKGNK
jgi:dipeptidyl aminopeptidase/acylaminoacyl peptidase